MTLNLSPFPPTDMTLYEEDLGGPLSKRPRVDYNTNYETLAGHPFLLSPQFVEIQLAKKSAVEETPNHVLLYTVLNPAFPIACDVLHTISNPFGKVLRIVIFRKNGIQAMLEFDSVESAQRAKANLHGCDIYSGCCTLKIEFAKPVKLNVYKNDSESYDYTNPNLGLTNGAGSPGGAGCPGGPGADQNLVPVTNQRPVLLKDPMMQPQDQLALAAAVGLPSVALALRPHHHQLFAGNPGQVSVTLPHAGTPINLSSLFSQALPRLPSPTSIMTQHQQGATSPQQVPGGNQLTPVSTAVIPVSTHQQQNVSSALSPTAAASVAAAAAAAVAASANSVMVQQAQGSVCMVYGLNCNKMNCTRLFNLFCLYGNVVRIKFLKTKEGCAMVQMGDNLAVERCVSSLNNVTFFDSKMQLGFSKQAFLADVQQPYELHDSSPSFMDFMGNKNNRFINPEMASKNRIQPPSKILHFFNTPPGLESTDIEAIFTKAGAPKPKCVKMFPSKTERSSSGLIEFGSIGHSLEALVVTNHVPVDNPSGKFPYIMKLCFSSSKAIPVIIH